MPRSDGFIVINRKIREWRWWGNPTAMSIWLYILVEANWKTGWWGAGSEAVQRGEFITSQLKMAQELGISRPTLRKYLKLFEQDGQIALDVSNSRTKISVINYAKYQDYTPDRLQPSLQQGLQPILQPGLQQSFHNRTNKQSNKETKKQERVSGSPADLPSFLEVKDYCSERGFTFDPQRFFEYYNARNWTINGDPVKDWKSLAAVWQSREKDQLKRVEKDMPDYLNADIHMDDLPF